MTRKQAGIIHQSLFQPGKNLIFELKQRIYILLAEELDIIGLIYTHPQAPSPTSKSVLCFGLREPQHMSGINADAPITCLVLLKCPAAGRTVPNKILFTHEAWLSAF